MTATEWILRLGAEQRDMVAAFRHLRSAQMLVSGDGVWLRGAAAEMGEEARRGLAPDAAHFRLAGSHLILEGERVPVGELPQGEWKALGGCLEFALPEMDRGQRAVGSAQSLKFDGTTLRLVRQPFWEEIAPAMVLLPLSSFANYVETAPEVRLRRWSFVISASGECLVRGEPLPPLPGEFFVVWEKIALPLGFTWTPAIDAATLRSCAGAQEEELLLLRSDCDWQLVELADFGRVSRAVVRAAREAARHG